MQKTKFKTINVTQGDFSISDDRDCMMNVILGSCVAVCLYDPRARIGGTNHFLLSGDRCNGASSDTTISGLYMMELLINALLRKGARRSNLKAKIFGGAQMINNTSSIGQENANFAQTFLHHEGFPILSESLGGQRARRVRFWPTTGKAQLKILSNADTVGIERKFIKTPSPMPIEASDVELF